MFSIIDLSGPRGCGWCRTVLCRPRGVWLSMSSGV